MPEAILVVNGLRAGRVGLGRWWNLDGDSINTADHGDLLMWKMA